jgi:hypothetical protein
VFILKIDIPKLISGPLLQSLAEHMHLYLSVRRELPTNASSQKINREVFKALGSRVHVAMRGKTANLRYFRNLTRLALPHLLTTGAANSKIMKTFLEELFPTKIMIPTMDFVATPVSKVNRPTWFIICCFVGFFKHDSYINI